MIDIFWQFIVVASIFALGVTSFKLAYWLGSPAWPNVFEIRELKKRTTSFRGRDLTWLQSGEIGELINLGLIATIALMIILLTPDVSLTGLVQQFPAATAVSLVITVALVAIYIDRARSGAAEKLGAGSGPTLVPFRTGYLFYSGYAFAIALLMFSIFAITYRQIDLDRMSFDTERAEVLNLIAGLNVYLGGPPSPDTTVEVQRFLEVIYGRAQVAEDILVDQVNSLLMLLLGAGLTYVTVYHTPIKKAFAPEALQWLRIATIIMVAICVAYGCFIFFSSHLEFIDDVIVSLKGYEPVMDGGPWDLTRRYHEIVENMTRQRGIIGFLLSITSERGGLVLVIPVINMVLGRKDEGVRIES